MPSSQDKTCSFDCIYCVYRYRIIYTRPAEGRDNEEALELWGEHES